MKINDLLRESTLTVDNSVGRPSMLSLTKALNHLIYKDLVAIQPTNQPVASLFGVKFLNPDNEMMFSNANTFGGAVSSRANIDEVDTTKAYVVGDIFKSAKDIVYIVTTATPFSGTILTAEQDIINEAVINGSIRYYSDAADTATYEGSTVPSEVSLLVNKWQVPVKSRKIATSYTLELLQDMERNNMSDSIIEEMLAQSAALEINKDIIQKLITVSKRYKVNGISDKGIIDVSDKEAQDAGRTLYRTISEMSSAIVQNSSFFGTYVLASPRVIGVLDASGLLKKPVVQGAIGKLKNGINVFVDITTPMEYIVVGTKYRGPGDFENVGSLFLAPYTETDAAGVIKVITDPASLQPKAMILSRYALSVNPYTVETDDAEARVIQGDDWNNLVGTSNLSYIIGVKLPDLDD